MNPLKKYLIENGISEASLAKETGLSKMVVNRLCRDVTPNKSEKEKYDKIFQATGITPNDLFCVGSGRNENLENDFHE